MATMGMEKESDIKSTQCLIYHPMHFQAGARQCHASLNGPATEASVTVMDQEDAWENMLRVDDDQTGPIHYTVAPNGIQKQRIRVTAEDSIVHLLLCACGVADPKEKTRQYLDFMCKNWFYLFCQWVIGLISVLVGLCLDTANAGSDTILVPLLMWGGVVMALAPTQMYLLTVNVRILLKLMEEFYVWFVTAQAVGFVVYLGIMMDWDHRFAAVAATFGISLIETPMCDAVFYGGGKEAFDAGAVCFQCVYTAGGILGATLWALISSGLIGIQDKDVHMAGFDMSGRAFMLNCLLNITIFAFKFTYSKFTQPHAFVNLTTRQVLCHYCESIETLKQMCKDHEGVNPVDELLHFHDAAESPEFLHLEQGMPIPDAIDSTQWCHRR